ncbi:hypothetical protein Neosp_007829 [[Neocosmospora] mangrovei]
MARMLGFSQSNVSKCIMQDNGGDWHAEAPKMASVFGNAIFTVAFGDCLESKQSKETEIWRSCSLQDAATRAAAEPFVKGAVSSTNAGGHSKKDFYRSEF